MPSVERCNQLNGASWWIILEATHEDLSTIAQLRLRHASHLGGRFDGSHNKTTINQWLRGRLEIARELRGQGPQRGSVGRTRALGPRGGPDVEQDDDGTWKIAQRVAPDRVISTVDPETRHMYKSRSEYRDGYKTHIAVEPQAALVTSAIVTPANVSDAKTALDLMALEPDGLEILADSAYGSGKTRADLPARGHRQLIKPILLRRAMPGGFCRDDFVVDHQARTITCPAGITVPIAPRGQATFGAKCTGCALRDRCTTSPRGLKTIIHPHDDELAAARRQWREGDGLDEYRRWRPMVERSIAWLVTLESLALMPALP